MPNYKTSGEICKLLKITPMTLCRWKKEGIIQFQKITHKKYLYDIDSVIKSNAYYERRKNVIYSRVSNSKQKDDLKNQTKIIQEYMASNGIIVDMIFEEIASGMNENRAQLNKLIQLVIQNKIDKIYVSFKDRLTRFGFDYFVQFFKEFGTEIVVINSTKEEDFQQELTQDLISIIHHFSMKMYSNRRKVLKEIKKKIVEENI